VAVFRVRARLVRVVGEGLAARAHHRRGVHHAEVVTRLLDEHDATGRAVVPGVVRGTLGETGLREPRPRTGGGAAAHVPEVMVILPDLGLERRGETARVTAGHRVAERTQHVAADV